MRSAAAVAEISTRAPFFPQLHRSGHPCSRPRNSASHPPHCFSAKVPGLMHPESDRVMQHSQSSIRKAWGRYKLQIQCSRLLDRLVELTLHHGRVGNIKRAVQSKRISMSFLHHALQSCTIIPSFRHDVFHHYLSTGLRSISISLTATGTRWSADRDIKVWRTTFVVSRRKQSRVHVQKLWRCARVRCEDRRP